MRAVLGIATIIGLALPAAIRLSKMKFAAPPCRGLARLCPCCVIVTAAMVQVQHRIIRACGRVIVRRQINIDCFVFASVIYSSLTSTFPCGTLVSSVKTRVRIGR